MSDQWTEEAVRSVLASLPPKSLAMLQALEDKAADWDAASIRARQLAVLYGVDIQVAVKADAQMTEAMGLTLDHAVFHGASKKAEPTPGEVHATLLGADGAPPQASTTRDGAPDAPNLPHSGEQPTPVQRRDAWLDWHSGLVKVTETHLRWSRSCLARAVDERAQADWLAKEWAALQLLKVLRDMKAPEVPVDHTLDQPSLEEGPVCQETHTDSWRDQCVWVIAGHPPRHRDARGHEWSD